MSKKKDKKKINKLFSKLSPNNPFGDLPAFLTDKIQLITPKQGDSNVQAGDRIEFELPVVAIAMLVNVATGKTLAIPSTSLMQYLDSGQGVVKELLEEPVAFTCSNPTCPSTHHYDTLIEFSEIGMTFGAIRKLLVKSEKPIMEIQKRGSMSTVKDEPKQTEETTEEVK